MANVTLDASLRPVWLVDAAGAATGWSPGGSGQDEFVRPESWGRWTARRAVEWMHAPALRFIEGGVLTGLPQAIDVERSDGSGILPRERLVLRAGEEHVELFVQRRSRGRFRWGSTDVPASRPVPTRCEPDWRVAHGEIAEAELLGTSKGQDGAQSRRVVLAPTFADGSVLHLRVEIGHENRVAQVVRHRAGLPGPWCDGARAPALRRTAPRVQARPPWTRGDRGPGSAPRRMLVP